MATKPKSRCTRCKRLHDDGPGRCASCRERAERERGTASERGYDAGHRKRFRPGVLARDPYCVLCLEDEKTTPATVADHYPRSRRELVALGLDPNDPAYGRGLCESHHNRETSKHQPGGWNKR